MKVDPINAALLALAALFALVIFPAGCESARDLANYRDNQEATAILRGHR